MTATILNPRLYAKTIHGLVR